MRTLLTLLISLSLLIACNHAAKQEENTILPLVTAAEKGDLTILKQLLDPHKQIDIRDPCQWTPLMKAALNGHEKAVKMLLNAGASVNLTDKGGYSAMMLAASNNHFSIVELLLNNGADQDHVENTNGWTALIWAAKQGHLNTVQALLDHHANPNIQDFQGKRAIDWAIEEKFTAIAILIGT